MEGGGVADKNVTVTLNGVDVQQLAPKTPPNRNFIRDYQVLLAGIIVASSVVFHGWWVSRMARSARPLNLTMSLPFTYNAHKTEVQPMPFVVPVTPPSPPTATAPPPAKSPWDSRLVSPAK